MYKKNKILIFFSIFIVFLFSIFIILILEDKEKDSDLVKVVACPSFYYRINKLNSAKFSLILTSSTSESLKILESGQADYAVGGRILYSHEPSFDLSIIGEGFSFLSNKSRIVYNYQLQDHLIYTDLDTDILSKNFGDLNYNIVDDVYKYLEDAIVITSWDNTDFNRAEIVHLLNNDNSRNIKSRLPTVFCQNKCNYDIISNIKKILN